mmetsp:Transcript_67515/g.141115  ORF Transcript_67515/g.141115 Transcript_67515/m.141115 type:complete len:527 (-) Transcript_67515:101-1681(-)
MACSGCFSMFSSKPTSRPRAPPTTNGKGHPTERATLRILTANDIYKPNRFAQLKTLVDKEASAEGPAACKFVLPGDLLGGSLFATSHKGESVIGVLNAMGVDYCTLGNHEFDFGAPRTAELMGMSNFAWLGSNVRRNDAERAIFQGTKDWELFDVPMPSGKSVKAGVFGLCTRATPELSHPGDTVVFEEPIEHAKRCVQEMQAAGCEVLIALTHLSMAQDKLVADACPAIRAVLGGHDHDPFLMVHHGVFLAKCGQNADHLGVLDLVLERPVPSSSSSSSSPPPPLKVEHSFKLLSTAHEEPDAVVLATAAEYIGEGEEEEELCVIEDMPLSTKSQELRSRENAFAGLVADAIAWSYRDKGCNLAIQNGGFVRQDSLYEVGTMLTSNQVREEMPFPKGPVLLKMTGRLLKQGIEEMLRWTPVAHGAFPQLSQGFHVVYDPAAPALQKIQSFEIWGEALDLDREYLVAISEFYVDKVGDNVEAFTLATPVAKHSEKIRDLTVRYFRQLGSVSGAIAGRVVKVSQPTE